MVSMLLQANSRIKIFSNSLAVSQHNIQGYILLTLNNNGVVKKPTRKPPILLFEVCNLRC